MSTTVYPAGPWTGGRITSVVLGSLLLLVAGGLVTGGVFLAVLDRTQRDSDGFIQSDKVAMASDGFALASDSLELSGSGPSGLPSRLIGDARLVVTPHDEGSVFVGLARTAEADAYLEGVRHSTLIGFEGPGTHPRYRETDGGAPAVAPGEADIWEASVSGHGTQTLTWAVDSGDWTVVVMNEDASAPVSADVSLGGTVPVLGWLVGGLLVSGGLLLLLGLALVIGPLRAVSRERGPRG